MDTAESLNSPDEIRMQIEETRASLAGKLETLESEVRQSVDGASESVKSSVTEIKRAMHPSYWVEERPWLCVGAAIAVGATFSALIGEREKRASRRAAHENEGPTLEAGHNVPMSGADRHPSQQADGSSRHAISRMFGAELTSLKKFAIGAAVGVVGDLVKNSLPASSRPELGKIIDSVAAKMKANSF